MQTPSPSNRARLSNVRVVRNGRQVLGLVGLAVNGALLAGRNGLALQADELAGALGLLALELVVLDAA